MGLFCTCLFGYIHVFRCFDVTLVRHIVKRQLTFETYHQLQSRTLARLARHCRVLFLPRNSRAAARYPEGVYVGGSGGARVEDDSGYVSHCSVGLSQRIEICFDMFVCVRDAVGA